MRQVWVGIGLSLLLVVAGCGGGADSADDDSSDSSSSSSTTDSSTNQEDAPESDDSSAGNDNESGPTDNDSANNDSADNDSADNDSADNDSGDNDSGDSDAGDDTANRSSDDADNQASQDSATDDTDASNSNDDAESSDDPIQVLVNKIGNPQLSTAYPQIRDAARETTAGANALYSEVNLLQQIGMVLLQDENRDDALIAFGASYDRAVEAEARLGAPPEGAYELLANVYYNGACVKSLTDNIDEAHKALDRAVEFGFNDAELLQNDTDLDALRKRDGFDADLEGWLEKINGDE